LTDQVLEAGASAPSVPDGYALRLPVEQMDVIRHVAKTHNVSVAHLMRSIFGALATGCSVAFDGGGLVARPTKNSRP
jgi:hypothetical protein